MTKILVFILVLLFTVGMEAKNEILQNEFILSYDPMTINTNVFKEVFYCYDYKKITHFSDGIMFSRKTSIFSDYPTDRFILEFSPCIFSNNKEIKFGVLGHYSNSILPEVNRTYTKVALIPDMVGSTASSGPQYKHPVNPGVSLSFGYSMTLPVNKYSFNMSQIVMSSYFQAIDTNYGNDRENFMDFKKKSMGKFFLYDFVNMGWGTYYLLDKNPFIDKSMNVLLVGSCALFDLLCLGVVIDGIVEKDNGLIIGGAAVALSFKLLIIPLGSISDISHYNKYLTGKYRIPRNLSF